MSESLPLRPIENSIGHTLPLPGSKSITNRALILAALAKGVTTLEGALFSRDTEIMLTALNELGFEIHTNEEQARITIHGEGGRIPKNSAKLHVGNAGTAARFLTAFLALNTVGTYTLDGDAPMRERPMSGLINALQSLEAADFEFQGNANQFPFKLSTRGYSGGEASVDASASSQILSALLLAAPLGGDLKLNCPGVRPNYVAITLKMRASFGAEPISISESSTYVLSQAKYTAPDSGTYAIEPDLSAASYFLALTLIHSGTLKIPNLNSKPLQGDAHFVEVLAHHGLRVDVEDNCWIARRTKSSSIQRDHREIDFNGFSDTFLTYAAIAPLLGGSVRITGIGHTRKQETDRIAGMAAELSKLGQLVKEEEDALTIQPKPNELRARALQARSEGRLLSIDTYEDHRFAMSFAILASFDLLGDGQPWLSINDPMCCSKTFPHFFEALDSLRND